MFRRQRREREPRFMSFQQCPFCQYNVTTGEGNRECNYGECAYLPEELDVRCPTCYYNFFTDEGTPGCEDPPTCDFARFEAGGRIENMERWLEAQQARS